MNNYILKIIMGLCLILISFFAFSSKSKAVSYATYFYGEPIVIEKSDEVEIISNDVNIDTKNSSVKNLFLLKNNSSNNVTTKIYIKLEDSKLLTSINNLKVIVNKTEIKYIRETDGRYVFTIKIPKNEGKKIEITYNTDNELKNAKVLKYTLDNLKGKKLKHFKISINLPEADVPLVTGIYPECYIFDNNIVSVEYYNFNVNSLTKDFIVEKQTYKNLLYGQETELKEEEKKVLKNAETWISEGLGGAESKYEFSEFDENTISIEPILKKELGLKDTDTLKDDIKSIIYYASAKLCEREKIGDSAIVPYSVREDWNYPLTADYIEKVKKKTCPLYGLTLAVDYVKSEGNKDLYVYKTISGYEENSKNDYVKFNEWNILKTKNRRMWYDYEERRGLKTIHINQDITGAEIDATDVEKVEYVNMINPSLYIRVAIYDGNVKENTEDEYSEIKLPTGYYGKDNLSIAKNYNINKDYYGKEYEMNSIYIDYDNEIIADKCKVPNLAHNVGYREYVDGKYVISFFNTKYHADGYGNIQKAINCDRAKKLKKENDSRILQVKNQIDNEISSLIINENFEEDKKANIRYSSETSLLSKKDKIVYITISTGIIILIFVIVILLIKRRKNNGRV